MRLGKLRISFSDWTTIEYDHSVCDCTILSVGCLVFEWLSPDCKQALCEIELDKDD